MSSKDIYNLVYNIDNESKRQKPSIASVSKAKISKSFNISAAFNPVTNPNFFRAPLFPFLAMV